MQQRLSKLIHYIISVTPPELGATKLAKIVWFADVEYYRLHGATISQSDDYQRRDQGPLHVDFNRAISSLKREGQIWERATQTPVGPRREFLWLKPADAAAFTGPEITVIHNVIGAILPLSATEASNLSHVEPWLSAYSGERLPVAAAAVVFGEVDDDDMKWAEEAANEHGAAG